MKNGMVRKLAVLILLLLAGQAQARNNGVGDRDLNISSGVADDSGTNGLCGNGCHLNSPDGGSLSITNTSGPYRTGQTGININVTFSGFTVGANDEMGVMLLNNTLLSGNIKNDGWVITTDPNLLTPNDNYNERQGDSGNYNFNWTLTAPGIDGTYYIKAKVMYRNLSAKNTNVTSSVLTMVVDGTPPSVTSNTNNVYVLNGTLLTLNATITDALSGVKNATVNVSAVNSTINNAVLTIQGGFWLNTTIIADRGATNGFRNLTITAYDNAGNRNNSINMTVWITMPPNITSWGNNFTNDNTLLFDVPLDTSVNFNVTANQSVNYSWTYNGADQNQNFNNFTKQFTSLGLNYINATVNNTNGTGYKNWTINVVPATIDVTLSNVPVDFGSVSAGSSNQPALLPLNVTIQSTTNVNVNLTLNGSDFTYLAYSFGVGNLSYSNSSAGTKINMATSFPPPPFANWVNIPKLATTNRSIYFWISIPAGQEAGAYSSNVSVRVEEYI